MADYDWDVGSPTPVNVTRDEFDRLRRRVESLEDELFEIKEFVRYQMEKNEIDGC